MDEPVPAMESFDIVISTTGVSLVDKFQHCATVEDDYVVAVRLYRGDHHFPAVRFAGWFTFDERVYSGGCVARAARFRLS